MPTCRRCQHHKPLIKAHIIPEAFWNLPDQAAGPMAMVSNTANWRARPSPIGPYDKEILCETCDGTIGKLDQHAVEHLLRNKSKTSYQNDIVGLYHYKSASPKQIISFVASLAWRASISRHNFFSRVNLGPFENKFFELMETGNSIVLEDSIIINEYDQDTPTADPHMSRIEGVNILSIQAERFLFHIKIDQRPFVGNLNMMTLHPDRPVISMLKNWNNSKQKNALMNMMKGITKPRFWN